ncbi:unnamed protein product [Heligmosomoides polygyrus]|uniref:ZM domain-containing protein n=1 Tax=Heligmosomoides polygyrus TaxID=6339 RepID=A0A183FK08_HELPZ|nr:unnamed protein product [Heligmosomoides polygyrus]
MASCQQAGPSEAVVLRLKSSRDISDVSLASSESSGCSSERSSVLRSPALLDETPVLHGTTESSRSPAKGSEAGTSSPTPATATALPQPITSFQASLRKSNTSEIIHHHPVFVKDTSKYWYKPTISREQGNPSRIGTGPLLKAQEQLHPIEPSIAHVAFPDRFHPYKMNYAAIGRSSSADPMASGVPSVCDSGSCVWEGYAVL